MMAQKQNATFIKGAAILAVAGILVKILGAIFKIPLVSLITSAGMGYYSSAYPVYVMLLAISTSGFPIAISKMISERIAENKQKNAEDVFKIILPFMIFLGAFISIAVYLSANYIATSFLHNPKAAHSLKALSAALLLVPIMSAYRGYFQGKNYMLPSALSQIFEQLGRVIVGLALAYVMVSSGLEYGAAGASFGAAAGAFLGLLTVFVFYRKSFKKIKSETDKADYKKEKPSKVLNELMALSIPIIVGALVKPIMDLIDANMVIKLLMKIGYGEIDANSMFGQLSGMATTMVNLPSIVISAIAMSIVPVISFSYAKSDIETAQNNAVLGIRTAILIGLPAGIGMMSMSTPIMHLLFPKENAVTAGAILFIAASGIVFLSLIQILTAILQAVGKVYLPVINLMCGVILKIVLNSILINDALNVKGAAIATVCAYIGAAALDLFFVVKTLKLSLNIGQVFVKPLIASLLTGVSAYFTYNIIFKLIKLSLATLISIAVGGAVYLVAVFSLKIISKEEIKMIKK